MIIGVDIGGTKTYVATFAENGKLLKEIKFETNHNYEEFLAQLKKCAETLGTHKAKVACAAVPGLIDRETGIVKNLGNLPWKDRYIQNDIAEVLGVPKTFIENDSKLAGLSEARYILEKYKRTFYLTLSTGVGGAFMINGNLVQDVIDLEIGKMPLEHGTKIRPWEEFASGKAFYKKYGKKAVDIEDEAVWKEYSRTVNQGVGIICANFQVDAIVFGGGLGQHFNRFKKYVMPYLEENLHPVVARPKALLSTHYLTQSVIYGCYQHAKDKLT